MEGQIIKILTELGLPPAIIGIIVSAFIWLITRGIRDDIRRQQKNLDQHETDLFNLREKINSVEKDAMQRYVGRDDYLVWMQRIEAKLDYLNRGKEEE